MSFPGAQALVALLSPLQEDSLFKSLFAEDHIDVFHLGAVYTDTALFHIAACIGFGLLKAALDQCSREAKTMSDIKQMELDNIQSYMKKAVNVGQYKSTDFVLILPKEADDVPPQAMQRLEYFSF